MSTRRSQLITRKPKLTLVTSDSTGPTSFRLANQKFRVVQILKFWRVTNPWWRVGQSGETKFWQVAATSTNESAVVEICYNELTKQWQLIRRLTK